MYAKDTWLIDFYNCLLVLGRVHSWRFAQPDTKLHFVIADAILILFELVSAIQKLKWFLFELLKKFLKS